MPDRPRSARATARARARAAAVALPAAGGLLYAAAFPPHDLAPCAWFTLVPLLWVTARVPPRTAFVAGATYGTVFFVATVPWVVAAVGAYFQGHLFGALLFSAAICLVFVAGWVGLFALAAGSLLRDAPWVALVAVPALWVTVELARATLFSGLPWELLGHAQWRWITLVQIADWGGVYALSFLVALVNVAVHHTLTLAAAPAAPRGRVAAAWPLAVAFGAVAASLVYGQARIAAEDGRPPQHTATIALVQGNQPRAMRPSRVALDRAVLIYSGLSRRVIADVHPDLVVWPEYALADYPEGIPLALGALADLAHDTTAGLIFGGPRFERTGSETRAYNSAHFLTPLGEHLAYDKVRLVPFAEYQPAPFATAFAAGSRASFGTGAGPTVFPSRIGGLGMLICYEVIFPELVRARVRAGAAILVNLSNDVWLDTANLGAGAQHLSIAVFRAIENRRYLARVATAGISGFVDPVGRVFAATTSATRTTTVGRVEPRAGLTFYARYGDVFAFACAVVGLGTLWLRRARPC